MPKRLWPCACLFSIVAVAIIAGAAVIGIIAVVAGLLGSNS